MRLLAAFRGTAPRRHRERCAAQRLRALAQERGFAMPTAVIVLFITTLLLAAALKVATQTSTSTTRDSNVKAEVEAAEAGLQVAIYRLNELDPTSLLCINGTEIASAKCESGVESLGNNATFQYWTTAALPTVEQKTCAGRTIINVTGVTQRCITAEGLVNSVKPGARLQELVTLKGGGEKLFTVKGVLGLSEVKVTGSVSVPGVVASNEHIVGEGSANFQNGYEICPPKGSFKPEAEPKSTERKRSGVKVHGVNPAAQPEYEKTRKEGAPECPFKAEIPTEHPTEASNEDSRIGVQDKLTGPHHTWNAEKYEFTLEGSEKEDTLTLGEAGKTTRYFFCSFKVSNGKFKIAAGAKVEMFIDNPELKESDKNKCAKGTGSIVFSGGAKLENEAKNPADLLIMVNGKGPVEYLNGESSVTLEASIYAPSAEVTINGGTKFKGGIVGNKVHLEAGAGLFEWSEESGTLTTGSGGVYGRETWEQCAAGSGATEGC